MCDVVNRHANLSRRSFLASGSSAALALGIPRRPVPAVEPSGPSLDVALGAERWIRTLRQETDVGIRWPWDSGGSEVVTSLYTGTPGVILFYLELHHATRDDSFLEEAVKGARELTTSIPDSAPAAPGLYVGLGGTGFCLGEVAVTSGDLRLRASAERCFDLTVESAAEVGAGFSWGSRNGDQTIEVTDIVSGAAGAGLALLYAQRRLGHPTALETAVRAGDRLLELEKPIDGGGRWSFYEGYERWMPNFSHGTAGVAYFLSQLYHQTGERRFLSGAIRGAEHLMSIAAAGPDWWRVMHHAPGGEDLHYLSWCHGPPGTARLYYSLAGTGEDRGWMESVYEGAHGVAETGIPEQRTPGFWNNVSQCCGDTGVAEFFLQLHRETGKQSYSDFADRLVTYLKTQATPENDGLKWIQAENRVSPDELKAQTGFMQGAAGVGAFFVHLDAYERGAGPRVVLPDSPYV